MKEKIILAIEILLIESLFFFAFSGALKLLRDEIWNFFFNLSLVSFAFTFMTCIYYIFFSIMSNEQHRMPGKRISSTRRKRHPGIN